MSSDDLSIPQATAKLAQRFGTPVHPQKVWRYILATGLGY